MSNMSYCRFENTLADLQDCLDNLEEEVSKDEHRARKRLYQVCRDIVSRVDIDYDGDAGHLPAKEY